jgi:hypothetical protein
MKTENQLMHSDNVCRGLCCLIIVFVKFATAAFNAGAKCVYFGLSVQDDQALWSISSAGIARCRVEP